LERSELQVVCRSNLSRNVVDAGVDERQVQMVSE
jgi:hypothetical protein